MKSTIRILYLLNLALTVFLLIRFDLIGIFVMVGSLFVYSFVVHKFDAPQEHKLIFLIVSLLNVLAFIFGFYNIEWFDNAAHFLNALSVTLILAPFFYKTFNYRKNGFIRSIITITGFGILIGVVWEFWEFFADIYVFDELNPSYEDTIMDLVYDMIGAGLAAFLIWNNEK